MGDQILRLRSQAHSAQNDIWCVVRPSRLKLNVSATKHCEVERTQRIIVDIRVPTRFSSSP